MAENTLTSDGFIANKQIGNLLYRLVKISFGENDSTIVSTANPLPVAIISGGGGGASGGLTNTELRATPVPVSGTVGISGTVPVSGSVSISGSVAVTGTFWQATQPVSIASMPSTPVTGTFWQATQPVSGPLTDTQLRASAVSVTFTNSTLAVTGPLTDAQLRATAVPISAPTLTKGTQAANGLSTQDLKDAGRTLFSAATVIAGVAAVSTEALLSLVPTKAGVASGAATSLTVTSGKTLRVTAIVASLRSTAATVLSGRVALRMNPSGAVTATSPIIAILSMTQQAAALAEAGDTCIMPLPDGLEFSGTQQIGLTQVSSGTGGVVYASLVGFEY